MGGAWTTKRDDQWRRRDAQGRLGTRVTRSEALRQRGFEWKEEKGTLSPSFFFKPAFSACVTRLRA